MVKEVEEEKRKTNPVSDWIFFIGNDAEPDRALAEFSRFLIGRRPIFFSKQQKVVLTTTTTTSNKKSVEFKIKKKKKQIKNPIIKNTTI